MWWRSSTTPAWRGLWSWRRCPTGGPFWVLLEDSTRRSSARAGMATKRCWCSPWTCPGSGRPRSRASPARGGSTGASACRARGRRLGFHPLCGVYPTTAIAPLASALAARSLEAGAFAQSLDPLVLDTGLSDSALRSVNRPRDLPPPAFSIIGNKKSGKTTLAVAVIAELARRGRRVMSVKHGHHFRLDTPGSDSWRHRHEGRAGRVLLAGPEEFALMGDWGPEGEPSLDLLLTRHLPEAEIVVVEGFRRAPVPKVEIYRSAVQPEPVLKPDRAEAMGALAVVTDRPELPWSVPVLDAGAPDLPRPRRGPRRGGPAVTAAACPIASRWKRVSLPCPFLIGQR